MPSLKSLKLRIKSIKSTQKITKAMKMVAASKLKRAREAAEAAAPYANRLAKIMSSLASGQQATSDTRSLLSGTGKDKVHLVIVAASDRGLCGGFNSSIIKAAKLKIAKLESEGKTVKIVCVGKKSADLLKQQYNNRIISRIEGIGRKSISFADASSIAQEVFERFDNEEFDVCHIIYNQFKSAILCIVTDQQLIPLQLADAQNKEYVEDDSYFKKIESPYDFEPSEEEILETLLPKNITVQIFRALLDNNASEQGARMNAMDNATRNSGEIIKKLTLVYNRSRQAQITRELIEIISGAEAV